MFINQTGNLTQARAIAKGNADHFRVPYVIYSDTSGNLRTCRQSVAPSRIIETIYPFPIMETRPQ